MELKHERNNGIQCYCRGLRSTGTHSRSLSLSFSQCQLQDNNRQLDQDVSVKFWPSLCHATLPLSMIQRALRCVTEGSITRHNRKFRNESICSTDGTCSEFENNVPPILAGHQCDSQKRRKREEGSDVIYIKKGDIFIASLAWDKRISFSPTVLKPMTSRVVVI